MWTVLLACLVMLISVCLKLGNTHVISSPIDSANWHLLWYWENNCISTEVLQLTTDLYIICEDIELHQLKTNSYFELKACIRITFAVKAIYRLVESFLFKTKRNSLTTTNKNENKRRRRKKEKNARNITKFKNLHA